MTQLPLLQADIEQIRQFYCDKDVLVTGGCGSVGKEIVKQLLQFSPKRVRVFDHHESGMFHFQDEMSAHQYHETVRYLLGNILDRDRLQWAMKGVDIVFHAAALKHVPSCEYNSFDAVQTNVIGTQNVITCARDAGVELCMAISTDKAVHPVNTMGATKLLSEKLILNAGLQKEKTKYACVRFGNVLASDGSVIPLFKRQMVRGNTITVTAKEMTRFFMSPQTAINLVLYAGMKTQGREIFILKMNSFRIIDLAEVLIEHYAPQLGKRKENISIAITGPRPGEKMHELLMTEEESYDVHEEDYLFVLRQGIFVPHHHTTNLRTPEEHEHIRRVLDKSHSAKNLISKDEIAKMLRDSNIL